MSWALGNRFSLLENGEEFFPAVFEAIETAEREVLLETFILFEDQVGKALHAALLAAAQRGVQVDVLIDGFGSPNLSTQFISQLTTAGVRLRVFDPRPAVLGVRTNWFRRMHRKIVVVDGRLAFVGGINYSADHLADFGPAAKQDYAVKVEGPIVTTIHRFAREAISAPSGARRGFWRGRRTRLLVDSDLPSVGEAQAMFIIRDNNAHRDDIERHYRAAIRSAKHRVVIANAYFFPGYRLLRDLRRAARRGVDVQLILQGEPDMKIVKAAAELLYDHLQAAGVKIYEYCKRPLHGKVALVDDEWSTVGSSNLDPLSLSLNLEANVVIRDRAFNHHLHERLMHLVKHCCKEIEPPPERQRNVWLTVRSFVVFHVLRRFPAWAGWLPAHSPVVVMSDASQADEATRADDASAQREVLGHGG